MNRFFQPAITAVLLSAALVVIAVTLLSGSVAQGAATYIKTDGTIVDPIMDNGGSPHFYSGNGLEPGADLSYASLFDANVNSADLTGADLTGATLVDANLNNADLDNADLEFAYLSYANLNNASLDDADLSGAYLDSAKLTDADLTGATLVDANLSGANLYHTNLKNANLYGVNLAGAYLDSANLYGATLVDADLANATLTDADLTGAHLDYANLNGATFSTGTTLYDGQTVLQHGYHDDPAGLQVYLKASPVWASSASNLTIVVPEPHTILLASLASMGLTWRRRRFAS